MYILRRIRFEKKEQYQRLEIGDILNLINFLPALLASIGNILIIIFYLKVLTNAIMEKSYEPTDTTSSEAELEKMMALISAPHHKHNRASYGCSGSPPPARTTGRGRACNAASKLA